MKLSFLLIFVFTFCYSAFSQRISRITITGSGAAEMFTIATDDAIINISPEGNLINYGIEYFSENVNNYSRLEKYQGRVDLFGNYDDKSFQGKLKYLGKTPVTYYASYDLETLQGKVKSIGSIMITYYMQYEDAALRGKIKSIGNNQLTWFSAFDNEALRGKLKSAGITNLSYYASFEDISFRGKIKTIGSVQFSYYPSFDTRFAGAMKTGAQSLNINGITFFIK